MLQTCKPAQKILHAILRRMVYSLSGNEQYLKSQFGKIGRFSCILVISPDFPDFVAKKVVGGAYRTGIKSFRFSPPDGAAQFSSIFKSIKCYLNLLIIHFICIFHFLIEYYNFKFCFYCFNGFDPKLKLLVVLLLHRTIVS